MKTNEEYNNQIIAIIKESKTGYAKKIKTNPNLKYLLDYINENTPLLDDSKYTLGTKIYWILNNIESWDNSLVRCQSELCNHSPIKHANVSPFGKYPKHCSIKCGTTSKECTEKKWKTGIEKYNSWPGQSKNARNKRHKTNLEKFGTKEYLGSTDCKNKTKEYNIETFGVEYYQQTEEYNEKCKQTSMIHYGVEHPMKSKDVVKTLEDVFLKKLGVTNPQKSHKIIKKARQKYFYDGQYFSSFAEVAYYIWLKDNRISFDYQPNISFEYKDPNTGKIHIYHPDFKVQNQLIEIKGNHFFKKDGTMKCPFKSKEWTEDDKNKIDNLYEAKHQCMIQNNVKILRYEDYYKYLKYVKDKYGIFKGNYGNIKIVKERQKNESSKSS